MASMKTASKVTVDRAEMVRRAADLVPVLAERALRTEGLRQIPEETVEDLRDSGLLRVANPDRWGGLGLDYDTVLEAGVELGRGCGSTAWCYTVWSSHNWMVGMFPEPAQEEYFGPSPDVISSSGINPTGARVEKVDGGYLVSGRWDFSSGCDAGTWALLGGVSADQGLGLFLIPRSQYRIEDTWFVAGLKGTGSKDLVIDSPTHVPEHRFLPMSAMGSAQTPGRALNHRRSYGLPLYCIWPFTLTAPLIGIAQGAVDSFRKRLMTRAAGPGLRSDSLISSQVRLGEASAEVSCARLLMQHDLEEMLERSSRNQQPDVEARVRYRRDQAHAAMLSVRAVDRLFKASGGHALFDSSPLQRALRDVHAGSHQVALDWDNAMEQYGGVLLGREPSERML
jgi:alkylation response protein AidB-like acyl-CoA dehydrogenase